VVRRHSREGGGRRQRSRAALGCGWALGGWEVEGCVFGEDGETRVCFFLFVSFY
jgi:hypothetical protein